MTRPGSDRPYRARVEAVAQLAVASSVTLEVGDIVDVVERALPAGYPGPAAGGAARRDVITQMARDILSGELYEDA